MRHAYLIELKYLSRGEDTPAKRQSLIEQARAQLRRYRRDPRVEQHLGPATLHSIVLLYSGWELVHREALKPLSDGYPDKLLAQDGRDGVKKS